MTMEHPYEELADYVDGVLEQPAIDRVAVHLRSCPQCTEDVEAARVGRDAVRELPDMQAPSLHIPTTSVSADPPVQQVARLARIQRWTVGGLAAAAAIALVFVIVLPRTSDQARTPAAGAVAESAPVSQVANQAGSNELGELAQAERDRYAQSHGLAIVNEPDPIPGVASGASGDATAAAQADTMPVTIASGVATPASAPSTSPAPTMNATAAPVLPAAPEPQQKAALALDKVPATDAVVRCLRRSGAFDVGGTLLRVYRGSVGGQAAIVAVLLEGKRVGATPDRVSVWVSSSSGCSVIGFAQAYLIYPSPSPLPPELQVP